VTRRYAGFDRAVNAIQLSRDGSKLFASSHGYERSSTILFNADTAEQIQQFPKEGWTISLCTPTANVHSAAQS